MAVPAVPKDIVIFGRGKAANGELTVGWVKTIKGGNIHITALEKRGRPAKRAGLDWRCHPGVVLAVIASNVEESKIPSSILVDAAIRKRILAIDRKGDLTAWRANFPDKSEWEGKWLRRAPEDKYVTMIKRLNTKTVGCERAWIQEDGSLSPPSKTKLTPTLAKRIVQRGELYK
jgi:hypothetical protein